MMPDSSNMIGNKSAPPDIQRNEKCQSNDELQMNKVVFVFMLVVTLGGCSLNRAGREEVSTALERYVQTRMDTARAYAQTPGLTDASDNSDEGQSSNRNHDKDSPAANSLHSEAKPTLQLENEGPATSSTPLEAPQTLRDFIVLALKDNPDVKAAQEEASAKAERIPQVTALPDPVLNTKTMPEPIRTAEGDNFFNLAVSQKLPVPEKLDRAGRIALQETRIALDSLKETRLRVIAQVKRAYFGLYTIDKSIEITHNNQDLLRGLIQVVRAQVMAGRRGQDDVLRIQVELSNLDAELIDLRQRRVTVQARLNEVLNRPTTTLITSPKAFDIRQADLSIDTLLAQAEKMNPALSRLKQQIERDKQAVKLAQLAYWPDFTIGFEWIKMEPRDAFRPPPNPRTGLRPVVSRMSRDGSDNWAINFGFTLPIWTYKIKAGIAEAERKLSASMMRYVSTRNQVSFQVTDALQRVRAQKELALLFRDTIIPEARQTYEVSQASYMAGTSDFLYVIDNWRKWLVFRIQYYRSLGELERSVADLEQALGLSLAELGG